MGEKKEKQQKTRDLENTTKVISDTVDLSFSCPVCVSVFFNASQGSNCRFVWDVICTWKTIKRKKNNGEQSQSEPQSVVNLFIFTRRDVKKMKCCVYGGAGEMGLLVCSPFIRHHCIIPLPTITTYQPQAKVAIARAYHLRLRDRSKAPPLVYFKLQPSRQFISPRTEKHIQEGGEWIMWIMSKPSAL